MLTPQTNADLEEIAEVVLANDDFVICGHVSPDGDCLGSQLALWHALVAVGKRASCVLVKNEQVPGWATFMPGIEHMLAAGEFRGSANVFVGVDVPTRERIGEDACALLDSCSTSVTIDHHAVDDAMCDFVYVDPDAASASMLVWELAKLLCDGKPPLESALCAYVGLATDTGGFRFQNCDVKAFACASELVEYGVDPAYVATNAFQNRTVASLRLESLVIDRLVLESEGRVSISWVTLDDMDRVGALKSDTEPLVDTIRSVSGVSVACMLREHEGYVKGSLRAKDDTDVSAVAREFGGGGHKAAAGFTLHMDMPQAVETMRRRLVALVEEG